ncbi:MAG: SDR family oxidoreductase [Candidatus Rokubacteria bacterium]|nr:SDR family oxidoreductase [Candidatus Rokubacteria bacterium]
MTDATRGSTIDAATLFSLRGKVALVTGGSSGIGRMIAQGYVEAGAKVYIASRKADVCEQVARELSATGPCLAIAVDLATADGRRQLCEQLDAAESGLHVLVNNAGTNWGAPLDEYPLDGFRKVTALNAEAVFFLTCDLLPLLTRAATADDPSRVINIGSIDGLRVPFVENYAYSAAKAAVHHMTRVLAVKLGPRHVTVNAIAPGPFESRMTRWLLEHHRKRIEAHCPLGRIGRPADVAGLAIYLASRAGAYVTGTVIPVDGGISAR